MLRCGNDIVELGRIRNCLKHKRFLEKYFSSEELKYFNTLKDCVPSVAANFAAKEAFSKALGTGIRDFLLKDVSILRDDLGAPYFNFTHELETKILSAGLSATVSLSHCKEYATAVVILYNFKGEI